MKAIRPVPVLLAALAVVGVESARAQVAGEASERPRCLNCSDPSLLELLRPASEEDTTGCRLEVEVVIEEDGSVSLAATGSEAPELCRLLAETWASRTRWELPPDLPTSAVTIPLEFAIDRMMKPRCVANCSTREILEEVDRSTAAREGLDCEVAVGLRIDLDGAVTATDMIEGSPAAACNRIARRWAERTVWTPAYSKGQPVVVWISQPLTFRTPGTD